MLISSPSPYVISLFLLPCFLLASPLTIPENHPHPADLHKRLQIQCLAHYQPVAGHFLVTANYLDCFDIVRTQILCGDKSDAPMDFSRVTGYTVPHRWDQGTCAVMLDVDGGDHTVEVDTLAHVADAVVAIIETCVQHAEHPSKFYGGQTRTGPHNKLKVGILGHPAEPEPPQRHIPAMCMVGSGGGGF